MFYQYDTLKMRRSSFLSLLYNVLMLRGEVDYLSRKGEILYVLVEIQHNLQNTRKYSELKYRREDWAELYNSNK